ncbi:MAG: hypothetical protein ACLR23_07385 [Clostridia bacterium]
MQTREEVHVVALFEQMDQALILQGEVYAHLPGRQAPPKILQRQHFLSEDDEVMGYCDKLLGFASSLTIEEVFRLTRQLGGAMIPAHIDRKSNSILSNLGFIPEDLDLATLEISMYAPRASMRRGIRATGFFRIPMPMSWDTLGSFPMSWTSK